MHASAHTQHSASAQSCVQAVAYTIPCAGTAPPPSSDSATCSAVFVSWRWSITASPAVGRLGLGVLLGSLARPRCKSRGQPPCCCRQQAARCHHKRRCLLHPCGWTPAAPASCTHCCSCRSCTARGVQMTRTVSRWHSWPAAAAAAPVPHHPLCCMARTASGACIRSACPAAAGRAGADEGYSALGLGVRPPSPQLLWPLCWQQTPRRVSSHHKRRCCLSPHPGRRWWRRRGCGCTPAHSCVAVALRAASGRAVGLVLPR